MYFAGLLQGVSRKKRVQRYYSESAERGGYKDATRSQQVEEGTKILYTGSQQEEEGIKKDAGHGSKHEKKRSGFNKIVDVQIEEWKGPRYI